MSTRSEQIYDELLVEYADENLQLSINNELLSGLKINKATLTRFMNKWIEQKAAKWIGTSTIQLILSDDEAMVEVAVNKKEENKVIIEQNNPIKNELHLQVEKKVDIPSHLTNVIVNMIESKFGLKITRELQLDISNNISDLNCWEKTVKNILFKSVPEKLIKDYLDYVIND
jgi:hypothetical protein